MDDPSVIDWYLDTVGLREHNWICPGAPLKPSRLDPFGYTDGRVDSAWATSDWRPHIRLNFIDVPQNRAVKPGLRAGSYGLNLNLFMTDRVFTGSLVHGLRRFLTESRVQKPSLTPLIGDCIVSGDAPFPVQPASNPPTWVDGAGWGNSDGQGLIYWPIARHGNRPIRIPDAWAPNQPLPGAINVGFFDGHVEPVQLERLWKLAWFYDFEPPVERLKLK